ncbi:MAG TPA: outer membrane protein assembly factor BamA [Tenuifilaceae bacterium]|nr:outer membrane protein assembly factor BamA [Tenuifilaceae bacterium]HOC35808.1 outer membrane protein assembly factor BamA [Tenuifilaceae bacterium]HOG71470.1 outer membrane protein assembly factor BamA [Tenuifilaceae bacterium]HOW20691.1 outer membrane protein assembly factor BamA [Tenuifilaceae bacterium]HPA66514.1 outer membrane protein assembly factor BamA [Tenuifilaceae bacterium]
MLKSKIFLLLLLLSSVSALAQEPSFSYEVPKKYCVKEVRVSGIKFLNPDVLVSVSGISVGDSILVPGDAVTKAIKKLWSQGLFSDIKISATKIENSDIYLDIFLQEQPRISSINFVGVRKGEVSDLKEKLKLRNGSQLTESILENSVEIIRKHYRTKGFLNVDVNPIQENDTALANMVKLTFDIRKNERVKIDQITFDGNTAFTDARLRKSLKKIHRRDINIFKSAKFIQSDYDESKDNLIAFYNENGYRDSKILKDSVFTLNNKRIGINFLVHEGPQYHIRSISWIGNTKLPSEALTAILGMKKGDVYDKTLLEKRLFTDDNSISTVYMDDGYLFFNLDPVESQIQNDSVDLEMRIYEGDQATINKVLIVGNTKTNEHVIRRELWTKPGYLFSKSEITRTIRELGQMGHFDPEKLDVQPMPNPAEGTVDLKYVVEEKANDQLEISGGWGNKMFVGTVGIRFTNFSVRRLFDKEAWRPVPSGDSQSLSLRASTNGTYYKAFSFSFTEPWLGGRKPTNFSFSVYHTIQNGGVDYFYQTSDKYFKVTGASVGIGTRLKWPDDYFSIYNEISYQNYNLKDWTGYFLFSNGQSNNLSYKISLTRNSTDQVIYPRTGSNLSLSLQITPPYSLFNGKNYSAFSGSEKYKWIEYHKWTGRIQWYVPLVEKLVLYSNFQFGIMGYFNSDIGHSPFEGFDVGGDGMSGYNLYGKETIGLRGYKNGSLTPYTLIDGSYVGDGHVYDKYTVEIRYPLTLNPQAAIYLLTFFEAGNAWRDASEFNPFNVHRSAGIGARMFLPMLGMLGIDWGYGFDKIPDNPDAHKGQFHFIIGMPF